VGRRGRRRGWLRLLCDMLLEMLGFSYDLGLVWLVNDRRISWWMLECAYIYIYLTT
jgi:hypothetical protein